MVGWMNRYMDACTGEKTQIDMQENGWMEGWTGSFDESVGR